MFLTDAEGFDGLLDCLVMGEGAKTLILNGFDEGIIILRKPCREIPSDHHLDVLIVQLDFFDVSDVLRIEVFP